MSRPTESVMVRGIGWVDGSRSGCVRQRRRTEGGEGTGDRAPWLQTDLFAYPVKNLGRFDAVTRMTICACALGLRDAEVSYKEGQKLDYGLLGTSATGSLAANRAYFQDYLQAGRTLARGNLFIYTLPSSPLAEAAIHFGLQGPMLYFGFPSGGAGNLLDTGAGLMADGKLEGLLAVWSDEQGAVAFVLGAAGDSWAGLNATAGDIAACLKGSETISEWALRLEVVMKGLA